MSDDPQADQPLQQKPPDKPQLPSPPPPPSGEALVLPSAVQTAAILEIVSGAINLVITWWVASSVLSFGFGLITAICTLGLCPIGVLAGFVAFLILPVAMVEIVVGVVSLVDPKSARTALPFMPWVQLASVFVGGFTSPIFGLVVLNLLRDKEAQAFLASGR